MIKLQYSIDGIATDAQEFRAHPQRVEAEDFLVAAYQKVVGHLSCQQHHQPTGYELRFISATSECKISTIACCEEFDLLINNALLQSIADNDPDK